MPPRSRTAAAALRVGAAVWLLCTWSLCACAPLGDAGVVGVAVGVASTTQDDGLYRAPPPGEDGAYLPGADQQGEDEGAYIPEKYETDESNGEGAYDAKKYESVEGFDDGTYHPQPDSEEHDDGSYHPEIAERTVGDDGSYRIENGENVGGEDGSYRSEEYDRAEGDNGLYNPQLHETVVGNDGAYEPDIAENVVGDDGSYHPDPSLSSENREGDYNPEIYEKVVGDDGSFRGTEEDDGVYHSDGDGQGQEHDGMYHSDGHERSVGGGQRTPQIQLQGGHADVARQTAATRVRRQQSDHRDDDHSGGVAVSRPADRESVGGADGGVYGLQTLEEASQQDDDGAYHPEKYETPAPEAPQEWDRYWTEGSTTSADAGAATPTEDASEASDDGSYRPEHHVAEDYDERADSGQDSVTPPVEPTEAADDGSYRPHHHTEPPPEDHDEGADNGTDWRDNVVELHDEGTEPADDGSYRPMEHGPRDRRGASDDTEEVQLSPVVFHVGPKPAPAADVTAKASGSVADDAISPRPAQPPLAAATV